MNHSKKDIQRLYKGISYEKYTISRLYNKKYEASQPNIDNGLDIQANKPYSKDPNKVYTFQVKSGYIKKEHTIEKTYNAGTRKTSYIRFQIKQDVLHLLLEQKDSYLVCYILKKLDNENDDILGEFWLKSKQLHYLKEQGYIDCQSSQEFAYINTFITTQADLRVKIASCFGKIDNLLILLKQEENQEKIQELNRYIRKLEKLISKTALQNANSNMNVYITPEWMNEQGKQCLSRRQHDFLNFDMEPIPENPFIE